MTDHQPPTVDRGVVRDISGETVLGYRVSAWRYLGQSDDSAYGHRYCEHWSTPGDAPKLVERLFTEAQLRDALSTAPAVERGVVVPRDERAKAIFEMAKSLPADNKPYPSAPAEGAFIVPAQPPAALDEAVGLLRRMFDVEFHGTVPTWSVERIRSVYGINRRSDLIVEIVAFLANLEPSQ